MKNSILVLIIFSVIIISCTSAIPSEEIIQTAIAETQSNLPTIQPTKQIIPTQTPSPIPTSTPSPTSDLRIYFENPRKLLPSKNDLPEQGNYYLEYGLEDWNSNTEILNIRGVEKGREYIINTGRITSWWNYFIRGNDTVNLPKELGFGVAQFHTEDGAILAHEKYNEIDSLNNKKYSYQVLPISLDYSNHAKYFSRINNSNKVYEENIEFVIRNYWINISACCRKENIQKEELIEFGRIIVNKIEQLELSNPEDITFAPTAIMFPDQ